jgi:hypothetical protein
MNSRLAALTLAVSSVAAQNPDSSADRLLDRVVLREKEFVDSLRKTAPLVETYIQEASSSPGGERARQNGGPDRDHYFLGRMHLAGELIYEPLIGRTDAPDKRAARKRTKVQPMTFLPRGFAQMALVDLHFFNRQTYRFEYVRREFLGEVRCLVFDVAPVRHDEPGRFVGRIWVEDRGDSIVRFNGTYVPAPPAKNAPPERYFHFDSWRVNVAPGRWAPAEIYVEEEGDGASPGPAVRFKAQTRFWDLAATPSSKLEELTRVLIDNGSSLRDPEAPPDISPLESQRSWERQAEENILARLEKGGFLAPPGPVDQVLSTVVNNLIVSADLNVEARCRVLLTTPMETFTVGQTIVISRGLLDVLPDEASLALMLADELSHIALGHRTPTQYAFHNRTMLSDIELLKRVHFERTPQEMTEAGRKTVEIMRASPYQKTGNAGLFLKALSSRASVLPRLLAANLGNQVADAQALARLQEFIAAAPPLEEDKLEQIAALPLGSRVKLNPWNDQIELVKTRPLALLSPREKMPFEVTPLVLYLTRVSEQASGQQIAAH